MEKSGRVFSSWGLADEFGFKDLDGRQPHWDRHLAKEHPEWVLPKCDDAFYEYWTPAEWITEEFTN